MGNTEPALAGEALIVIARGAHDTILHKTGIVINPRGRLFEIAPQFIADKSQRLLDFGWCTLRMNVGAEK